MGEATETVLIEVAFDTNDLAAKAAQVRQSIQQLRTENRELQKDVKAQTATSAESAKQLALNDRAIKENTATLKTLDGQIQANIKSETQQGDSLIELRSQLSTLTNQYASLTKAERESARGTELRDHLLDLRNEIAETEAGFGDFRRNVGNYPKEVEAIIPGVSQLNGVLGSVGLSFGALAAGGTAALKTLGTSLLSFGKLFVTPPIALIVGILSAILLVVNGVRDAFQRNNDAATRLQKAFATFQPIVTALNYVFNALATGISYVVEWGVKLIDVLIRMNPIVIGLTKLFSGFGNRVSEAAAAARELVQAQDDLLEAERNYTVESARRSAEIARLRDQAIDKENQTAEARATALRQAVALEQQNLDDQLRISRERLRIVEQTASQEQDTSNETLAAIAQARAELYRTEEQYFTGVRRLRTQLIAAEREAANEQAAILKEQQDRIQAAAATQQAARAKELAAIRALEDEIIKSTSDAVDRQVQQMQVNTERQIAALRTRLETERDLTIAAREAINETILRIEQNGQAEIQRVRDEYERRMSERAIAAEVQRLDLLLKAAQQGGENEYNLRIQQIELLRQQALSATNLTLQEIANINSQYDAQILEQNQARLRQQQEQERIALENDFEMRRQEVFGRELELAQLQLEQERLQQEQLVNLDEQTKAAMFATQQAYEQAVIQSNARVQQSTNNVLQTQQRAAEAQAAIFGATVTAINTAFGEIAGDNERFANFQKVLALALASTELGLSIAAATRTASMGGDPYTVAARIAAAVGGVIGAFASVVANIKKSNIPNAPKFARGGIVPGRSYTGDNVMARVNSGEMILTAKQQARLFDIANSPTSEGGFDYEMLADVLATAVADMPTPVLDYSEFVTFEDNIVKFNEYARI